MTPDAIVKAVLLREGSRFTDRAADRGGPTKFGITLPVLSEWYQREASVEELKRLTYDEARQIYLALFVQRPGFLKINDDATRSLAIDCAVNHGRTRAIAWLQRIAGVKDDGVLGPNTELAVNRLPPRVLYARLLARRVRFYGEIIVRDPGVGKANAVGISLQAENAGGWLNRASEFIEQLATTPP